MSVKFNAQYGLVIVELRILGPTSNVLFRVALDTGATTTTLNAGLLMTAGYDPSVAPDRVQITTGSGIEFVPRITLTRIEALGKEELRFPVLCHTLPASAGVDGVLGLDFLRGCVLKLDFKRGRASLAK